MLDGWYCRSMNEQALQQQQQQLQQQHPHPSHQMHQRRSSLDGGDDLGDRDGGDSSGQEEDSDEDIIPTRRNVDYKTQYNTLKKKLKYLLYENEFFQENLRTSQRRLLKVTRDRSFLLDRLLQYEKTDLTSSESEDTESSDDSSKMEPTPTVGRKRKNDASTSNNASSLPKNPPKRRKPGPKKQIPQHMVLQQQAILQQQRQHQAQIMAQLQAQSQQFHQQHQLVNNHHHQQQQQQQQQQHQEGHLTTEEVERHLQSRAQSMLEVVPEGELPNEMFSQNPSSESNDQMVDTSPSNIGEECLSADLNMMQQE
ncbi:alpha-protein kinase 1 [Aedes albopictus]|uniref:INO80 complex subunit E N-terminal domain-containing protein n=1 Tax=Aedes albopictus TaxID=7160 RepID=A0ABM1XUT1_AEDAL|nr:alpha-protein kinase 1 [Aedes albopictus]